MQNSNSCRCTFWLMLYCYEVGRSKKEETGKKEGKPGILAMLEPHYLKKIYYFQKIFEIKIESKSGILAMLEQQNLIKTYHAQKKRRILKFSWKEGSNKQK